MSLECPECGTKESETVNGIFSGPEPAIRRDSDGEAECVKCGFIGVIRSFNKR